MTHYRMQDSMPSAIILAKNPRTSSLDELRTYQGNQIFLNNGDEFQIRLFNPLREKIGVQIGINGDLSQGLLVLNPGEDVVLDRFLDDKSKMIFETYSYDANNKAASDAVAENGIVDVKFFKEKKVYRPQKLMKKSKGLPHYGSLRNVSGVGSSGSTDGFDGTFTTTNNVFYSHSFDDGDYTLTSASLDFVFDPLPENKKETGRVEKGDESTQNFYTVDVEFESFPFYTLTYYLKPTSERGSTTVQENKVREYCTNCGYRIRNSRWNFCPKCGDEV